MHKKQWVFFGSVVIASVFFSYHYFDQALPFVKIPISMTYEQAKEQAKAMAEKYDWGVADFDVAAYYQTDGQLQAFVELEGGGKQAFIDMIEKDYHQPYLWNVRLFQEKQIKEIRIGFTPSGKPYEFYIKLPEDFAGAALSKERALAVAMGGLLNWNIDLTDYDLVEHQREELVSGRVDHEFIYQRKNLKLGEAFYRLKLKVSGDLFSSLQHSVKIPDEFVRRYAQMFSINKMFAGLAFNIGFFLYLFIFGLFIFVFFFHRKGGLLFKQNLKVMCVLATIFVLNACNNWPLIWHAYPTHVSRVTFIMQKLAGNFFNIIFFTLLVGFIVLVAEAAGRFVFSRHIQFFKLWTPDVVGSYQIAQQTLLGYGFAIIMLAYETGFSLFAQKLGWWSPLTTLIDPNILSTRMPFFSPLVMSFQAGFWEEFFFRALPIAGILLLMYNSRHKKFWFVTVFIAQILIFGACHATYPQQPAYYRIVELMSMSTMFGLLYYRFGLLPGIICHFTYDAILFCVPIFVSGLLGQQILAILCMLIPLFVVAVAWFAQKMKLHNVAQAAYNQASSIAVDDTKLVQVQRLHGGSILQKAHIAALICGVIGLFFWSQSKDFEINTMRMTITPAQAETIARKTIADYAGQLDDAWSLTRIYESPKDLLDSKYIWQTFGNDGYQKLQGSYLPSPSYTVKFVKFHGPVEDRSEVFEVRVQADGSVAKFRHAFPEFWAGADISQHYATILAYEWIEKLYGLHQNDLQLVSSTSVKHAKRRDWTIIVKDIKNYPFQHGQARIQVAIAGDKLSNISRFVHAPEDWTRSEQSRMTQEGLLRMAMLFVLAGWFVLFMLMALSRFGLSVHYFAPFVLLICGYVLLQFVSIGNNWFTTLYGLSTAEPIVNQIITLVSSVLLSSLVSGLMFAIMLMSSVYFGARSSRKNLTTALPLGIALGCSVFAVSSIFKHFEPTFAVTTSYAEYSNFIMSIVALVVSYFIQKIILIVVTLTAMFACIESLAKRVRYAWAQPVLFMLAGLLICDSIQLANVAVWIASGLVMGVVWYLIYRYFLKHDSDLIWIITATVLILQLLPTAIYGAYPGAALQILTSCALTLAIVSWVYRKI